jgi:toxin ParE1/3/4
VARITLRSEAETDVLEIWGYIADDSVVEADHWLDRLDEKFALWAEQPSIGRSREELAPGLRSMPFGRYVVFFMPQAEGIDIVRVLHGSRDVDQAFV